MSDSIHADDGIKWTKDGIRALLVDACRQDRERMSRVADRPPRPPGSFSITWGLPRPPSTIVPAEEPRDRTIHVRSLSGDAREAAIVEAR